MPKKAQAKRLPAKCPKCGKPQLTVWLHGGRAIAVDPGQVEVVFCNQAMAGGRKLGAYTEHKC